MFRRKFYLGKKFIVYWHKISSIIWPNRTHVGYEFIRDPKKPKKPKLYWAQRNFRRKANNRGRHFNRKGD